MQVQLHREATDRTIYNLTHGLECLAHRLQGDAQEIENEAARLHQARRDAEALIMEKEREIAYTMSLIPRYKYNFKICWLDGEVQHLRRRTREIDSNLLKLQSSVLGLQHTYEKEERHIVRTKNYFSPLYSLPVELLRHIFDLCREPPFPTGPTWYSVTTPFSGNIPITHILLSQVSTRFRDIIHGSPELWSDIHVDAASYRSLNKLRAYLRRSADNTIRVTFFARGDISNDEIQIAWMPIIPHVHRIGTLNLSFRSDQALAPLLHQLEMLRAPRLTSFTALCNTSCFPDSHINNHGPLRPYHGVPVVPLACFSHAPKLVTLDWEHALPNITPWSSRVRRMRIKMPHHHFSETWLPALASFSGLVALNLVEWNFSPRTLPLKDAFVLPKLRYLKIIGSTNTDRSNVSHIKDIFDIVQMPKLESLGIGCLGSGIEIANLFYRLCAYPCQEFPSLRLLSFYCLEENFSGWSSERPLPTEPSTCFSTPFEHVEKVAFVGLASTDKLLGYLFSPETFPVIQLPKMKLLSIGTHIRLDTVKQLISRRNLAGCPISTIELNLSYISPLWDLQTMEEYSEVVQMFTLDPKTCLEQLDRLCFPPLEELSRRT